MKIHFNVFVKTTCDLAHNEQFKKLTQTIHKDEVTITRKKISYLISNLTALRIQITLSHCAGSSEALVLVNDF